MFQYRHHIFVCINQRPTGHPKGDCDSKQSRDVFKKFQEETEKRQLWETVAVSGSTCLGPCAMGANVVIYPDGVWYGQVGVKDVEETGPGVAHPALRADRAVGGARRAVGLPGYPAGRARKR